jgi:excisionase family DNA binding protein
VGSSIAERLVISPRTVHAHLRVPEVAVILNISRSNVYELFSSGDLESVKIDRIRLVRSSDLRAYVDQFHSVDKSACICWPRSSGWTGRIIARSPAQ